MMKQYFYCDQLNETSRFKLMDAVQDNAELLTAVLETGFASEGQGKKYHSKMLKFIPSILSKKDNQLQQSLIDSVPIWHRYVGLEEILGTMLSTPAYRPFVVKLVQKLTPEVLINHDLTVYRLLCQAVQDGHQDMLEYLKTIWTFND